MNKDKVLVVDDEDSIRASLKNLIEPGGYTVITASDGNEAIDFSLAHQPRVIISDIHMPKMNGLELLEKIKEVSPFSEMIMITGFSSMETFTKCLERGAFGYIKKPFKIDQISELVEEAVKYSKTKNEMFMEGVKDGFK